MCGWMNTKFQIDRGWGSLAACNTMLLIIPATRNSILTWFLGLPFDHVVIYHRWLARFTLLCVLIHFCFYLVRFFSHGSEWIYLTG
jgi:predicted ferric reductase